MKLDTYHRYAALFDAFATVVGEGGHCSDVTLFDDDAGPALCEWATARGLYPLSEDMKDVTAGTWTRIEVVIGRYSAIRVHLAIVSPTPAPKPNEQVDPEMF